jgi:hypothetical protein
MFCCFNGCIWQLHGLKLEPGPIDAWLFSFGFVLLVVGWVRMRRRMRNMTDDKFEDEV